MLSLFVYFIMLAIMDPYAFGKSKNPEYKKELEEKVKKFEEEKNRKAKYEKEFNSFDGYSLED